MDLDTALAIATRDSQGPMILCVADCQLANCRLHLDEGRRGAARRSLDEASAIIQRIGYHRRDSEMKDLQEKMRDVCIADSTGG
jgi:hypothetical protein